MTTTYNTGTDISTLGTVFNTSASTIALAGRVLLAAMLVLAGFTLAASVLFHNFWAMPADQAYVQQLMFMKNISVAGGLLMIVALGGGALGLSKGK